MRRKTKRGVGQGLLRALLFLLVTALLLTLGGLGALYVTVRGPSPSASRLFLQSVRETNAGSFLARVFYSEEELAALFPPPAPVNYEETDPSLLQFETAVPQGPDAWGLSDEDGDGIILEELKGERYTGYMMVVLDPARVIVGTDFKSYGVRGYTVEELVKKFDAVAGINGGGFVNKEGRARGCEPSGLVIYDGEVFQAPIEDGFAGLDRDHILHVGCQTLEEARSAEIQYGLSFGPVLVQNGRIPEDDRLDSGLNPRTAIGQRSDGAMLLLVIDGRQFSSFGASFRELSEIMLSYGAVNAVNLDGGSSSMMFYNGSYVNRGVVVEGINPIPTAFLVLRKQGS